MQDVTQRFLAFCDHIIAEKIPTLSGEYVSSRSKLAQLAGKGASIMTEMSKGRQQVGLDLLQKSVQLFPDMNPRWILTGEGEMFNAHAQAADSPAHTHIPAPGLAENKHTTSKPQLPISELISQLSYYIIDFSEIEKRVEKLETKLQK